MNMWPICIFFLHFICPITFTSLVSFDAPHKINAKYKEINHPTPNIDSRKKNLVQGVILHHTAEPTIERSLAVLTSTTKKVGTHVVIDTDGTRYIMASPETVTYHAGFSVLDGKEGCNYFTIGIEFQGNTLEAPLTKDQIESAIEYLLPLISKYKIPIRNIVTHEMIRQAYKKKYPKKKCSGKVDITQTEYKRFMKVLKKKYEIRIMNYTMKQVLLISAFLLMPFINSLCIAQTTKVTKSTNKTQTSSWITVSEDEAITISYSSKIEKDKRGNHIVWVKAIYRATDWQWYFANQIGVKTPVTMTKTKAMYDPPYHYALVRQVICYSKTGKVLFDSGDDLSGGWSPVNASDPVGIVGEYLWDQEEKKR